MAQNASDSQKIDYLWKKIVYGAAKTDIAGNIDATNEPNPSPLQIRADRILQDSASIPGVIPVSNSSVVTVYPTTFPVECTSTAGIPTPTLTWQTGQTFWVPPEFGSTYQIKVYIAPSGNAANVASKGTQVFATGSGSNDLWVFDYQSGILNFNSNNTPYSGGAPISFTGNSVYISGGVYNGQFGLPTASNIGNLILGNITISGNTISSKEANGNIMISAPGTGVVQFVGQDAIGLPSGDDTTRPLNPVVGYTRFNTSRQSIEYYDGTQWLAPGEAVISSDIINPDGASNTYPLSSNTTVDGVLVSINGTLQQQLYAYDIINNNQIQFTEIPLTTDVIEVRHISVGAVTVGSLRFGAVTAVQLDSANVNVTGNLIPSANVTYSLGSPTLQWKDLYVSSNTIYMGGTAVSINNGQLAVGGNLVLPPPYGNTNVIAYTETMGFKNYSNVNVIAYTETMGFKNYSNVNVSALITTNGLTNYSNVNVSAYLGGSSITVGGNLTVNGNLLVNGNVTTINANNLSINDSLIYLAAANPADTLDIGFVGHFVSGTTGYQHNGFVRDASDGVWKLFANVVSEPTTTVDFTNATYANLKVGNLSTVSDISVGGNLSLSDYVLVPTYGGAYNNQLTFRSSTADDATEIQVGPSGPDGQSGGGYGAAAITVLNNVDATNAGYLSLLATSTYTQIDSSTHGAGTRLPLSFRVGGEWRVEIDTGGNVAMARNGANNYSNVNIAHTTPSTDTTTGALQVAGGVGVAGRITTANLTVTNTIVGNISGNANNASYLGGTPAANYAQTSTVIGVSQSWQNVSGSRSSGVTYTNSTGKPIFISIRWERDDGLLELTVDGLLIGRTGSTAGPVYYTLTAIVPAGSTYLATATGSGGTLYWHELR